MPTIRTHELMAEAMTDYLKTRLASTFGVKEKTVQAWCRAKESDLHPTGTGKSNPLDGPERYIRVVHPSNPGNARQAALYLLDVVDELDRAAGLSQESEPESILAMLRELISESNDVTMALMGSELGEHALKQARREIAEAVAAMGRLDQAVRAKLMGHKRAEAGERIS
jgi:hypothetical protein